jgi:hypothetical protein
MAAWRLCESDNTQSGKRPVSGPGRRSSFGPSASFTYVRPITSKAVVAPANLKKARAPYSTDLSFFIADVALALMYRTFDLSKWTDFSPIL